MTQSLLHVLKSPPDQITRELMKELGKDRQVVEFKLYGENDYERLVELVFAADQVISWR
ncbi:hypothetical protein [Dethiosulfatarculus sandiegensis]|nr:hypothetical protein [Dethiosulfatarculus sandiegensis]